MWRVQYIRAFFALVIAVIFVLPGLGEAFTRTVKADLTGSGKNDVIILTEKVERTPVDVFYLLTVNDSSIKIYIDTGGTPKLSIVAIDDTDKHREIVVNATGPDDQDEYWIYWYDGKTIRLIDELWWVTFSGHGFLYAGDHIGFWFQQDKYVLNKQTMKLDVVEQPYYYVGVEASVITSIPLYTKKGGTTVVANLKPKSKVIVLLYDPIPLDQQKKKIGSDWYLIKTESGLVGWASEANFREALTLPYAD